MCTPLGLIARSVWTCHRSVSSTYRMVAVRDDAWSPSTMMIAS
jgi:hypothetical protein